MGITKTFVGIGVGLTLLLSAPGIAHATDTADRRCHDGAWPESAQGQPTTFQAGAAAGVYLWHDRWGWHLRVTHPGSDKVVFTGTVEANAPIRDKAVRNEGRDVIWDANTNKAFHYSFKNYGYIDGVDFRTRCATALHLRLSMDGVALPVTSIFVGASGSHPATNPFAIERQPAAVASS